MKQGKSIVVDIPDRRSAILAAALECFNESGIEGAAIGDISRRSAASIGSIYHHFGNKEGIVVALLADGIRSHVEQLERNLRKAKGAEQGVRAVVISVIRWIVANPDLARFIYTVTSSRLSLARIDKLESVNRYYAEVIEGYFGSHMKTGAFRDFPRECLAPLVMGPVHDYARRWLDQQTPSPLADHAELFADAAWRAVRSEDA